MTGSLTWTDFKKWRRDAASPKECDIQTFFVYRFTTILIHDLGLADKPNSIFNMDETGFPTDPSKAQTIGTKGVKTVRVKHGFNQENISMLATCSADGTALPPRIIYKRKRMQST